MNKFHVLTSVLNRFSAEYAGDTEWGNPLQFDPVNTDLDNWVGVRVDSLREPRQRGGASQKRVVEARVVCHCWSRKTDNFLDAHAVATAVDAVYRHQVFPVKDFSAGGEPTVGNIRFHEGQHECISDELGVAGWQLVVVTFDGCAEEC